MPLRFDRDPMVRTRSQFWRLPPSFRKRRAGVMPPWYAEKDIGIQHFKDDPSLSELEILTIAKWADTGVVRGDVADLPAARHYADAAAWNIGTPDLIVKTTEIVVKANTPDWWGEIPLVPTGLTEDRYVVAMEVKEVNDVPRTGSERAVLDCASDAGGWKGDRPGHVLSAWHLRASQPG